VKTRRGVRKNLAGSFVLFGAGEVSGLDRTAELELSDHIPVSEMKDVTVSVDGSTTAGYNLDGSDGIVR
jgi:hypothetical protein